MFYLRHGSLTLMNLTCEEIVDRVMEKVVGKLNALMHNSFCEFLQKTSRMSNSCYSQHFSF